MCARGEVFALEGDFPKTVKRRGQVALERQTFGVVANEPLADRAGSLVTAIGLVEPAGPAEQNPDVVVTEGELASELCI